MPAMGPPYSSSATVAMEACVAIDSVRKGTVDIDSVISTCSSWAA